MGYLGESRAGGAGARKSYAALASFRPCPWPRGVYVIIFLSTIKKLILMRGKKEGKIYSIPPPKRLHFRI